MTHSIEPGADRIDVSDVTDRVDELRNEREDLPDGEAMDPDKATELAMLEKLLGELCGYGGDHQWEGDWYPGNLTHDRAFVDAMRELVLDIGDLPHDLPNYLVIDWDATADNLRADYSSVEYEGETYWYR